MKLLLWAERWKLRRSKILWIAGFATVMVALIVFAQGQFMFYGSRYIDKAGWFMTATQSLATFYVLPAVIALLGSYMICREEQEDTLKYQRQPVALFHPGNQSDNRRNGKKNASSIHKIYFQVL